MIPTLQTLQKEMPGEQAGHLKTIINPSWINALGSGQKHKEPMYEEF